MKIMTLPRRAAVEFVYRSSGYLQSKQLAQPFPRRMQSPFNRAGRNILRPNVADDQRPGQETTDPHP
jgi:hypothetical protein